MFRAQLEQWLKNHPETSTEYHFPGQSYTGPGTHIATRLLNGLLPANKTDFVTLLHDIEYSVKTNPMQADLRAIRKSEWDIPGIATKIGLTMRTLLDKITPGSVFRFDNDLKGSKLMMHLYYRIRNIHSCLLNTI